MDLGRIIKENRLDLIEDWIVIEKLDHLDGPGFVGRIIIPNGVNLNIRESKIGVIRAAGSGTISSKGRWSPSDLTESIGCPCYYARYGKTKIDGADDKTFIVTRQRGVICYVDLDDKDMPIGMHPRLDRLLVQEIDEADRVTPSGLIIKQELERDAYRRYRVLEVGPGRLKKVYLDSKHLLSPPAEYMPTTAQVGDVVLSSNYNGVQISWHHRGESEYFRLIPESECIAIEAVSV